LPEGTGICGGTDLERRKTVRDGKDGRGGDRGEEALGRAPLSVAGGGTPEVGGRLSLPVVFSVARQERVEDLVPDVPTSGWFSRGKGVERSGSVPPSTTKWPGGLIRGNAARVFFAQGKHADPLGMPVNQSSRKLVQLYIYVKHDLRDLVVLQATKSSHVYNF
jgi:hypothetical protein